jgi:hypothetical protein
MERLNAFLTSVTIGNYPNQGVFMRLPPTSAAYDQYITFGRYVTRRLRRQKLTTQAQDAEAITLKLKTIGRAWEDAAEPLQEGLADRDGEDDSLDIIAKEIRQTMASRSLDAIRKAPYIEVFPLGIEYYTTAPLDEEEKRYGELQTRLEQFLLKGDALLARIDEIKKGVTNFREASNEVDIRRGAQAIAKSKLDSAIDVWRDFMGKLYGVLISQFDKVGAERFFPKNRAGRSDTSTLE